MTEREVSVWNKSQKEELWLNDHSKIRSYEVSVWTLQDDFITVLKHSNLENKGQIQEPRMVLNTDGTQELSFSIPMYLYNYNTNRLEENPIWYNTRNGNIAIDMRKIKVIFNKAEDSEAVFEFLITKVNESHSNGELICEISCDGLAFHELGKVGYKISLSSEDFLAEDYQWFKDGADAPELDEYGDEMVIRDEEGKLISVEEYKYTLDKFPNKKSSENEEEQEESNGVTGNGEGEENAAARKQAWENAQPLANINYWLNKFLEELPNNEAERNPRKWYYSIEMNYNGFIYANKRDSHVIYEEPYAASWEIKDDVLKAIRYEELEEKARLIDEEESNIYNLTQNLAEAFGVFCRYEYLHDENYHIIGRKVIFYNNFIYEEEGFKDLTYPYDTSEVTREMDSSDLATKMFVKAVEDDTIATGMLTIIDTEANNSGEDYLLNFDYLYKIGTISEEQYKAISIYEKEMKKINLQLIPLESRLIALEAQLPSLEAKLKIASNAIQLDKERLGAANDLYNAITEGDGEIEVTAMNPETAIMLRDPASSEEITEDTLTTIPFYINITKRGVDANSIRIFRNFDVTKKEHYPTGNDSNVDYNGTNTGHNSRLYGEILTGRAERDEFGDVVKITNLYLDNTHRKTVFLTFNYNPKLYYDRVIETWTARLEKDLNDEEFYTDKVDKIKTKAKKLRKFYNDLIEEKNKKIKKFEHMMGPALREGYWAPDDYKDCGDKYTDEITIPYGIASKEHMKVDSKKEDNLNYFIWDKEAFEDELNCEYTGGFAGEQTEKTTKRYPYIDLRPYLDMFIQKDNEKIEDVQARVDQLSFFFCDYNGLEGLNAGGGEINSLEGEPVLNTSTSKTLTLNNKGEVIDPKAMRCFSVGSQCQYGFIKDKNNQIVPALILTGFDTIPDKVSVTRKWTEVKMKDGEPMLDEDGNKIYEQYSVTNEEYMMKFIRGRKMMLGTIKPSKDGLVFDDSWSKEVKSEDLHDSYPTDVEGQNEEYSSIYPRMVITSLSLKTSSDQLFVSLNKKILESVKDYYCLSKVPGAAETTLEEWEDQNPNATIEEILEKSKDVGANYYITLKPEVLLKTGTVSLDDKKSIFGIMYTISNADTAIYLDAKQILKENAWPRASYTVKLSLANRRFLKESYNKLRQIVHINDAELKFENTMGYISQVTLDLDKPWEDQIEVKNYKTKFEDLFSNILATMNEMKKSSYAIRAATAAFFPGGSIKPWAIEGTIYKADLDYAFNNGKLTIDEKNGIWGVSESGVVAIRGGGIFTSTEQDGNGNWKWNTGITPEGINATLITAGQLDTNRVMVYAGDKLRFQLNGEGLFAYKSFFADVETINEWENLDTSGNSTVVRDVNINTINAKLNEDENSDLDATQFVKMDSDGLALVAKEGALVLNSTRNDYISVGGRLFKWTTWPESGEAEEIPSWVPPEGIKRASISWDGLTLRNYYNQKVLYADADSGNLNIKGTLFANEIKIGGEDEETSLSLNEYLGNPDSLIVEGLTLESIEKVWPKDSSGKDKESITVYYTTENDLINYLDVEGEKQNVNASEQEEFLKTHKQGETGDIWYNTRAPMKDLTIFNIKKIENPKDKTIKVTLSKLNRITGLIERTQEPKKIAPNKYDYWQMRQIKFENKDFSFAKALLGIFQSNITGSKYNTIYKVDPIGVDETHPGQRHPKPIIEETSHLIAVDESGKSVAATAVDKNTTWQDEHKKRFPDSEEEQSNNKYENYLNSEAVSFRVETDTYMQQFLNEYEPIPLEEQSPNLTEEEKDSLRFGDIWINTYNKDDNNQIILSIYRWEPDYDTEEQLLIEEGELIGEEINTELNYNFSNAPTGEVNPNNTEPSETSQEETEEEKKKGKWVLIRGISKITSEDGLLYDLTAAEGKVGRIAHGEYGLIFSDSKQITDIQLNKRVGLQIKSGIKRKSADDFKKYNNGAYFRVNSSQFGFVSQYKDQYGYSVPYLYYEDGNLFIMGTIFAKNFYVIDRPGGTKTDFDSYINFKFEDNVKVSDTLKKIFKDAGQILTLARRSITDVNQLVTDDFEILEDFRKDVAANLTPNVTRGPSHTALFKPGDIWEKTEEGAIGTDNNGEVVYKQEDVEATYVAIAYWHEIYSSEKDASSATTSTKGWSRTHDYSLAAIKGASMDIDAVAGTIEFKAENHIDIKSGGNIYIAANEDVEIVGNKSVNIGGTTINIASSDDTLDNLGGIHLVATKYDGTKLTGYSGTSMVDINGEGIKMASKGGIEIESGAGINILASAGDIPSGQNKTSVISIDKDKGIWMGSDQKINLFSGSKVIATSNGDKEELTTSGSAVEIGPTRILMGVSNLTNGKTTALDITESNIILGAGIVSQANNNNTETTNNDLESSPYNTLKSDKNLSGVVISKDAIGMATGTITGEGDERNLLLMDEDGIIIGVASDVNNFRDESNITGSFVSIANDGIRIGSTGHLYIRSKNVFLDNAGVMTSGKTGTGFGLGQMSSPEEWSSWNDTTIPAEQENNSNYKTPFDKWGLVFDGYNLHVKGHVYAQGIAIHDENDPGENGTNWYSYFNDLFKTAAEIIGDIRHSASKLGELNSKNDKIFKNFQQEVSKRLEVKTYPATGTGNRTKEDNGGWDFKPGDIWNKTATETYLAMTSWYEVYSDADTAKMSDNLASTKGWVISNPEKSVGGLQGAKIYEDANLGIISLWGSKGIHLFSSENRGNSTGDESSSETKTSSVDITKDGINLASSTVINLGVYGTVTNVEGTGYQEGFSGIKITPDELFLGSNTKISLFSTNSKTSTAASMTISPTEILFGVVSENNNTSVVDITGEKIIIGVTNESRSTAGTASFSSNGNNVSFTAGTAGMRIMNNQFGLVTNTNGVTNAIVLDSNGIGIGSKNENIYTGVLIHPDKLVLSGGSSSIVLTHSNISLDANGAINMTGGGSFSVKANNGYLEFTNSKGEMVFKVDTSGNLWCNSINAKNIVGTSTTADSSVPIGYVDFGMRSISSGSHPGAGMAIKNSSGVQIHLKSGREYTAILLLKVSSGNSGYLQHCRIWLRNSGNGGIVNKDTSVALYEGTTGLSYTFTGTDEMCNASLDITLEAGSLSFDENIRLEIYENFNASSTDNVVAQWGGSTYSVSNYGNALVSTTIKGEWSNGKYIVKGTDNAGNYVNTGLQTAPSITSGARDTSKQSDGDNTLIAITPSGQIQYYPINLEEYTVKYIRVNSAALQYNNYTPSSGEIANWTINPSSSGATWYKIKTSNDNYKTLKVGGYNAGHSSSELSVKVGNTLVSGSTYSATAPTTITINTFDSSKQITVSAPTSSSISLTTQYDEPSSSISSTISPEPKEKYIKATTGGDTKYIKIKKLYDAVIDYLEKKGFSYTEYLNDTNNILLDKDGKSVPVWKIGIGSYMMYIPRDSQ